MAPATATPTAPNTPAPRIGDPCIAALVLWAIALLEVPVVCPDFAEEEPEAVVFALALLVCLAVAEPAVITTGRNAMSEPDKVAVVKGGISLLGSSSSEPDAVAAQTASVVPMSLQSYVTTPLELVNKSFERILKWGTHASPMVMA